MQKKSSDKKSPSPPPPLSESRGGETLQNENNRTKYIFFNLRKMHNRNKWKNYVIVTRIKLSIELDVLVIREPPIFIQL